MYFLFQVYAKFCDIMQHDGCYLMMSRDGNLNCVQHCNWCSSLEIFFTYISLRYPFSLSLSRSQKIHNMLAFTCSLTSSLLWIYVIMAGRKKGSLCSNLTIPVLYEVTEWMSEWVSEWRKNNKKKHLKLILNNREMMKKKNDEKPQTKENLIWRAKC
jgi:hypothetical protein